MSRLSDHRVHTWLEDLQEGWWALHHDNPDIAGAYASEVFGGGYTRVPAAMTPPDGRAVWNSTSITFTGLPAVRITHLGLWSAQNNGDLEVSFTLPNPQIVIAGHQVSIPSETLAISFD